MPIRTSSIHEVPLGTKCPNFQLKTVDSGETVTRESIVSQTENFKGLCIMALCNHCPVVGHIRPSLALVAEMYAEQGIAFLAIMPNELGKFNYLYTLQSHYHHMYRVVVFLEPTRYNTKACFPNLFIRYCLDEWTNRNVCRN